MTTSSTEGVPVQSLLLRGKKKKKKEKTRRSMNMDAEKTDHIMKKKVSRCDDGDGFHFVETLFVKRRSTTSKFSHFFQRTKTGASTKLLRRQAQREKHRCDPKPPRKQDISEKPLFCQPSSYTFKPRKESGEKKKKMARHIFPKGHRLSESTGAAQQLSPITPKSKVLQIPSSLTTPSEEQFFGAIMTSIPPL